MKAGERSHVVGQEDQSLLSCWVLEPDTAQVFEVVLRNVVPVQCNGLITDKTAVSVYTGGLNAPGVHVAFAADHKEGACLMHLEKASKVYVASIHVVERPWLQDQDVQNIDLVHLAVADEDDGGNDLTISEF
jgi:hypothetical protein